MAEHPTRRDILKWGVTASATVVIGRFSTSGEMRTNVLQAGPSAANAITAGSILLEVRDEH